jgi:hypothetical protein
MVLKKGGTCVWHAAVVDRGIEGFGDVGLDRVGHAGVGEGEEGFQLRIGANRRVGEQDALVRVVAGHDFKVFSKGAVQEQDVGVGGNEDAIDDRAVDVTAVGRGEDLVKVCADHFCGGDFLGFGDA